MKTQESTTTVSSQSTLAPAVARAASKPLWGILMILGASFVLYGFSIWYPLARDQAIFAYIADRIKDGGLPYKDAWDFKSPGVFYLYTMAFTIFGRSQMAVRLFDMSLAMGTSLLLWHMFYRRGKGAVGVVAGVVYGALYGTTDYWTMGQTEGFGVFFTTLAAYLLLSARPNRARCLIGAGLALGAAFLIKLPFAMVGLGMFIPAVYLAGKGQRLKTGLILGLSAAVIPAAAIIYFAANGILGDALTASLWYAGKYRNFPPKSFSDTLFDFMAAALGRGAAIDVLILPLYIFGFIFGCRDLASEHRMGRIWLVSAIAVVAVQLKSFFYHWVAILGPASLLAGLALCAVSEKKDTHDGRMAKVMVVTVLLLLILRSLAESTMYWGFLLTPPKPNAMSPWMTQFSSDPGQGVSYAADVVVADYIKEHTVPGESVLVFGFEPLINFLSERPAPTRFVYMDAVTAPWTPPEWREEYVSSVRNELPAMIVVAHNDAHVWRAKDSATTLQEWPEMAEFVRENYIPDVKVSGFDILKLKGN